MKSVRSKERCGFDKVDKIRCKKDNVHFNTCGSCQSCLFTSKLYDSTQWLPRAGDASKRRFLTGILVRCQSLEILQNIKEVLKVTLGKDFTYTRSLHKPSLPEDMVTWSSDRGLDTKVLRKDIMDTWNWFSRSSYWTKFNYLLGILSLCDTELLHVLRNLTDVLIVREKRAFLQFNESTCSINSLEVNRDLELLLQASPFYKTVSVHNETDIQTVDGGQELSRSCHLHVSPRVSPRTDKCSAMKEDGDTDSCCSDDPALMVVPRSSTSLSGVSRYRDFIRRLPVHLAKKILALLDKRSLRHCKEVSPHWRYLTGDTLEDLRVKKLVEKQTMLMQKNITTGVSSTYAKVREVLVPIREDEKHICNGEMFSKIIWERGFAAIYAGVRTRAVQMEERNVFCGVFNIMVLMDREDSSRVVHYGGGQLVAVGSKDRRVRLLDVETLQEVSPMIQGHAGSIRALLLCEERDLVISASYDLSIRCWNLKTGTCVMLFHGHLGTVNCLDLEGNWLVSGGKDCRVKVWNMQTGKCYEKLKFKHQNPILCVKIEQALVLSSCDKGLVKMWGLEAASLLKTIDAHQNSVKCLFFDQWHILSGGSDGEVKAWSTSPDIKKSLMTYRHPKEVLTLTLVFLRVITGCGDGKIRIFNFLTGDCLRVIKAGAQHTPTFSLHIHNNMMVVNTQSSVRLYRFTSVLWDYSLPSERECIDDGTGTLEGCRNRHPYSQVRAERMALVGSSNRKIYDPTGKAPENPLLSHHARSLSAPSMRQAHAAQLQSMRPATWSELQNHRRSRAYIDLQPEFITKPPSATSPGRPVSQHIRELQSRTSYTPSGNTISSDIGTYVTSSEKAVMERVKKRGPHHSVTSERILLKVNPTHPPTANDQARANMELNARVRDAWGSPPALSPHDQKSDPEPQAPSPPPAPSQQVLRHSMTTTYTHLLTHPLDLKLKSSLHSREVRSSVPSSAGVRPYTGRTAFAQSPPCPERAQTSCGKLRSAVRKVGAFTTSAQENVQAQRCMFLKTSGKGPGRRMDFMMENKTTGQYNPLDPFREHGAFVLLTDSQLEDYVRAQNPHGGEGSSRTREEEEEQRTMKMKVKGVSATNYTKLHQVYAPELGHDVYR
ncbi:hypothetical protein UPYG_G00132750 [Umbra pygmaea]|uniref:F-box domain-containing protein n=1 Tax=Umbra pygmaea TaxID=75934 RepID=A0ABD0XG87_UMBPY